MKNSLTEDKVYKTILKFSIPFFLSYFLQTLYGMADLYIIGKFNGMEATNAVSIGSQVMHMITVMIVGLAMGTTVSVGRAVGAKKHEEAGNCIGNTAAFFGILSLVIMAVLLIFVKQIVKVMSTPQESVESTIGYLRVCFIGVPFIVAYNIISAIFRGMGDSKSPMYFIAVACVFNIGLDYLFVGVFRMGATGAALGTTIAQTISVAVSLFFIIYRKMIPGIRKSDFALKGSIIGKILGVGVPVALQDGFIQISFIVITVFANKRGLTDATAVGVVEKIIGILFLVPSSMLSTVSALCAQNIGAGRHDRAKSILGYSLWIVAVYGVIVSVAMQFAGRAAVGFFRDEKEVVEAGYLYLRSYSVDCLLAGMHFCFSGYFCAYGLSSISFLHNMISILCARIPLSYLASIYYKDTLFPMGCAAPIGSLLSVLVCILAVIIMNKKGITGKN